MSIIHHYIAEIQESKQSLQISHLNNFDSKITIQNHRSFRTLTISSITLYDIIIQLEKKPALSLMPLDDLFIVKNTEYVSISILTTSIQIPAQTFNNIILPQLQLFCIAKIPQ